MSVSTLSTRSYVRRGWKSMDGGSHTRAKQIFSETDPKAAPFSSSDGWFTKFKSRYRISKRRATNCCQREPDDKQGAIQNFHQSICRAAKEGEQIGPLGWWTAARHIANMDQTPLPFTFCSGETYTDTGERSVCMGAWWCPRTWKAAMYSTIDLVCGWWAESQAIAGI